MERYIMQLDALRRKLSDKITMSLIRNPSPRLKIIERTTFVVTSCVTSSKLEFLTKLAG